MAPLMIVPLSATMAPLMIVPLFDPLIPGGRRRLRLAQLEAPLIAPAFDNLEIGVARNIISQRSRRQLVPELRVQLFLQPVRPHRAAVAQTHRAMQNAIDGTMVNFAAGETCGFSASGPPRIRRRAFSTPIAMWAQCVGPSADTPEGPLNPNDGGGRGLGRTAHRARPPRPNPPA